ncbi:phosphatidylserine decarboxylase family protein [Membranihabitans maritimus]|uniref:phosphatidylserine decarboxylase family protein n=1 Tax=Membranihabitans maritimus TaxID=2904244 RepID=UPI001EFF891E|nr:phosphatidylserine decarboxylase family protein [Membranihabitans maritimus]
MSNFIHKEGNQYVNYASVLVMAGLIILTVFPGIFSIILFIALFILLVFILYFFRNPLRPTQHKGEYDILCPADGEVVVIEKVLESEYFNEEKWQISIFMSPLNVHVNRVPISGKILYYKYHPGKYLVAWHPKSSTENERNTIVLETHQQQKILLRQIAGAMARRIVCYKTIPGDPVQQGEDLGFIKFGSRVDIYLPLDAKILVSKGQKVKGNIDVVANLG